MQNKMVKNFLALSVAALVMGTAGSVSAAGGCANVVDASGTVVRDSSGNCVRSGTWKPENVGHPGCEGYVVAEAPPAAPPPAPTPAPEFVTTTLSAQALFDFDKATLRPEGRQALTAFASQLTAADASYTSVLVEGHTCSIGTEAYNQGLSERRAKAVADFLVSAGIRPDAIRQVGYGETRPTADNATRAGREQNRRVEITTDVRKRAQ
jgi:OmpA-OmpF porin, OOP family